MFKREVNNVKNKYIKIQILAIAILLLGTITVSGVTEPDEVCIKLNFKQGPLHGETGYNVGRWRAKGAISDGGLVLDNYEWSGGMSSYYTMSGKKGDIFIHVQLTPVGWINEWTLKFEGDWTIDYGTGIYAGVSGGGDATQLVVVSAAMHSVHGDPTFGAPATSNHVILEGTIGS